MNPTSVAVGALVFFLGGCSTQSGTMRVQTAAAVNPATPVETASVGLSFDEFFVRGSRSLEPSPRLLSSAGERVRISGFMVRMDLPPVGGFYMTKRPLVCDEAGAGTADLPPEAVLVKVVSPTPVDLPFIPGPLVVTGTLQVGREEDADGTVSQVRLLLNGPPRPQARTEKKNTQGG